MPKPDHYNRSITALAAKKKDVQWAKKTTRVYKNKEKR